MKFKADTHLHGDYSNDSSIDYRRLCLKAIKHNYKYLVITEHYDLADSELVNFGLLPLKYYFNELELLRSEYPELEIVTGLEIGEPHITMARLQELFKYYQPDFLIGSLHVTRSGKNVSLRFEREVSKECITEYYEDNLEMVEKGGFDTLGHLGIFKRSVSTSTMPDESHAYPIIDEIFRTMIKNNIALEVNNSGFKSNLKNHVPDPVILARYKKLGGELITVSSDSHDLDHFDRFYDKTLDNLRELNFSCMWIKRDGKWVNLEI